MRPHRAQLQAQMARPMGVKEREGILRDALAEAREQVTDDTFRKSLVNYAAAPLGAKKYDSNTLTNTR